MMGDLTDAKIVVNTVFTKVFASQSYPTTAGQFGAWLNQIVKNACIDALRQRALHPALSLTDESGHLIIDPQSPEPDPLEDTLRHETADRVQLAICELPEHLREVVVLYYYEEHTLQEIAEHLGLSRASAVSYHIRQALNLLEKILRKGGVLHV